MKRGQASFEYIILIGMILVLIIPLFYYAFTTSSEISVTLTSYGETSEVVGFTRAPLVGTLDSAKGTYRVRVEHLDSGAVLIGTANDTTDPYITWKSPTALSCNP